jgi:CBS domain-containing protein
MPTAKTLRPLTLRVRHVAGPQGTELASTVFCPTRGHSFGVAECERCSDFVRARADPFTGEGTIECMRPPEPPRPRSPHTSVPFAETPLSTLMTTTVHCAAETLALDAVLDLMLVHGISGIPVVDVDGCPIGMVTKTDILRITRDRPAGAPPLAVQDAMTPIAFTLEERAPIAQAAALMGFEGVHRLPVVGDDGTVVGILSALDVARWVARQDGYVIP